MRLYSGKVPVIADEIIGTLVKDQDIEVGDHAEVKLDIEAVMKEYLRQDREILEEAKNRMEIRGLPYSQLGKMKSMVARERQVPIGDEMLPYVLEQLLTMLFHSQNVEEVFSDDIVLRKKMTKIMRRHLDLEGELDQEVRSKIKNLQEGTASFEIEYQRVMDEIKRKKRLT
ncbi:MAG: DUF507 family protein [Sandaracinaceae bacterium]|nr:MAG: DUF507 family protein [Sandaracinaceae bacterium]HBQ19367.1 DUF507 domain-containing protein [Myxococcales bacterium]